jgi:GDP-L-fucose synthase
VRKFHDAREEGRLDVNIWGSGKPRREFLHVDDLADACVFLMRYYDVAEHVNVGTGEDVTIRELADLLRETIHPAATLTFDSSKPDGAPRKLLNVDRIHALGWKHRITLREGVMSTYRWFLENRAATRL